MFRLFYGKVFKMIPGQLPMNGLGISENLVPIKWKRLIRTKAYKS